MLCAQHVEALLFVGVVFGQLEEIFEERILPDGLWSTAPADEIERGNALVRFQVEVSTRFAAPSERQPTAGRGKVNRRMKKPPYV